jgi:hypothetical protein
VTYTCNTGYSLSSFTATRTCQADGTWSLPVPVCSIQMLTLTVSKVGTGASTDMVASTLGATGISCGNTCVASYAFGTTIYLSATADANTNQTFMGWSNSAPDSTSCTGMGTCQFTITSNTTVTARFSPPPNVMFTTSKKYTPNLGGLSGADTICNQLAAAAGLSGYYVAWLSTTAQSALSRLGGASGWVRPDGRPVFSTVDDLYFGRVFYPPRLDESGNDVGAEQWVMTNTLADGSANSARGGVWAACQDFTSETEDGTSILGGLASDSSHNFTQDWGYGCSMVARLYCLGINRQAQVAVIPAQGRRAFVTTNLWTPGGGIYSADAICQSEATSAKLPGTYLALLATTGSYSASRFSTSGLPWVRSDGILIAQTASAFFSTTLFDVAPNMTADGSYQFTYNTVWSGAATPMTYATDAINCTNWTSTSGAGNAGRAEDTSTNVFFNSVPGGPYGLSCSTANNLLCLQNY